MKTSPETQERKEETPELELVKISRSEGPINEVEGEKKEIESLEIWHDQSIVLLEGSDTIEIFDEQGRKDENFKPPKSSMEATIDWGKVLKEMGKSYLSTEKVSSYDSDASIEDFFVHLRKYLPEKINRELENRRNSKYIELREEEKVSGFKYLSVSADGKYVISTNKEGGYIGYITENEFGVTLAPRNWKRFDPSYIGKLPEDLSSAGTRAHVMRSEGYRPDVPRPYFAVVTDDKVSIKKRGEDEMAKLGDPSVFEDNIPSIGKNLCTDPENSSVIFYCSSENPKDLMRLDLEGDPGTWQSKVAEFPGKYENIDNLRIDPSGAFFVFSSGEDLVFITKDTLEEVRREPNLSHANFDENGNIRAVDNEGHLVTYKMSAEQYKKELDKRRIEQVAQRIDVKGVFSPEVSKASGAKGEAVAIEGFENLETTKEDFGKKFREEAKKITDAEGVKRLRQGLIKLEEELRRGGLKPDQVQFVTSGIESWIEEKEKEFATQSAQESLDLVKQKLQGSISVTTISEARAALDTLQSIEPLLDEATREEVQALSREYAEKSSELFRQRGAEIIKDVRGLLDGTKRQLEGFESKSQMDEWIEFELPQLKSRLGALLRDCPLEAEEAYKAISSTRDELQRLSDTYDNKFKQEYSKVRERAADRMGALKNALEVDISDLIERIEGRGFTNREDAEKYLLASETRKVLAEEIKAFASQDPDTAKALERSLKSKVSNVLTQIEQGAFSVAETGQQMTVFGETQFPKWEAKVLEKGERRIEKLTFEADERSRGPGVKAGEIMGDVMLLVSTPEGTTEKVRLYEGLHDEDERRLGLGTYRGEAIPPSYVTASEFTTVNRDYNDWKKGEKSGVRKELSSMRNELRELYSQRQKPDEREAGVDEEWQKQYKEKLEVYSKYYAEHNVSLLKRVDQVSGESQIEETNGKGFVPEWQSHWVVDGETEKNLEEMAQSLKMQLDLQEGLLNLKGHAGTGKDVSIKMFAARTNRPYFATDCTKWTTEVELSEDIVLESKDGASQTVKVPSAVLNGITTPGGIVYFNEINSMPEQAQIFLHSLMDEKRSLTLKTSSGKVIKADPSVLLVGSMNPGYPGTFEPQFATRSRMVDIEIGYPALMRERSPDDPNPNPAYTVSEALRVAREVDSLSDLTYDSDLRRNEFVQMWDRYVNGIDNGSQEPTVEQKFDIDAVLSLVQFADTLRGFFIRKFEKIRETRNEMDVSQPITGRELRRCAYELSKMKTGEKATANPEVVARNLINKFFVSHIDSKEKSDKIRTAMSTWTSQKRMSVGSIEE